MSGGVAAGAVSGEAAGEAGASRSGGAGARPPFAGWIDPDLLEKRFDDCVCVVCSGLMVEPTSGCPDGHSFCRACYVKKHKGCPTCRNAVDKRKLVRNRPLEGMSTRTPRAARMRISFARTRAASRWI